MEYEIKPEILFLQKSIFGDRFQGASFKKAFEECELFEDVGREEKINEILNEGKGFTLIQGPPGTGKTFLCSACLDFFSKSYKSIRAYNECDLFSKIRSIIGSGIADYIEGLRQLIDYDILIIDDLGFCEVNEWRREIWMYIIDYRYAFSKKTIITTNLKQQEIYYKYGSRIRSRLFAHENTIIEFFDMNDLRAMGY